MDAYIFTGKIMDPWSARVQKTVTAPAYTVQP